MATEVLKMCSRCRTPKPLGEFGPSKRMADGLTSYCRPCMNDYRREWLKRNPDAYQRRLAGQRRRYAEQRERRAVNARIMRRDKTGAARTQRKNTIDPYRGVSKHDVVPAAPFVEWLCDAFPLDWTLGEIADVLKVPERRLRGILHYGTANVSLDLVDRALTIGMGRPDLLNVLYPVDTERVA